MAEVPEDVQRWTAKRRVALVPSIVRGETSVAEAARKHGLTVAEVEEWQERFVAAAENALRSRPKDEEALEDEQIKKLKQKVGEVVLDLDILREAAKGRPTGEGPRVARDPIGQLLRLGRPVDVARRAERHHEELDRDALARRRILHGTTERVFIFRMPDLAEQEAREPVAAPAPPKASAHGRLVIHVPWRREYDAQERVFGGSVGAGCELYDEPLARRADLSVRGLSVGGRIDRSRDDRAGSARGVSLDGLPEALQRHVNREVDALLAPDRRALPTGRAFFYLISPTPMLLLLSSYGRAADAQVVAAIVSLLLPIVGVAMIARQLVRGAGGRVVLPTIAATFLAFSALAFLVYDVVRTGLH